MAEDSGEETNLLLNRNQASSPGMTIRGLSSPVQTFWKRRGACGAILLTVMFERLAFYGIPSSFVLILNKEPYNWLSYEAANTALLFLGISYVSSVLGGILADTLLGRFKTIVSSFIIYNLGMLLLVMIGYASVDVHFSVGLCGGSGNTSFAGDTTATSLLPVGFNYCAWAVYIGLIISGIGTGSVSSNLSPFGGDQVRFESPKVIRTFFSWFYWAINVGSLVALAGVTVIQQNVNFFVGLLVRSASLIVATVIFVVGRTWYLSRKPMGSVLTNTFRIICEAFKRRKLRNMMFPAQDSGLLHRQPTPSFMDMAKVGFGGSFHEYMVNDVKSLKKIFLVLLGLTPHWVIYFQMQTTFLIQGFYMRFMTGCVNGSCAQPHKGFQIPPAWLSFFDIISVLILLPVFDRVFYPWLDRHGISFTLLRRMIVGMFFAALSMITAGVLEHIRLQWVYDHRHGLINETIGSGYSRKTYYAADIWVFWQIPQYSLIGISEVFASVAGLEFAYIMAPRFMQGLLMGLFYFIMGIAAFISSGILKLTTLQSIGWFLKEDSGNINNGRLDLYFYMLGGFQMLALVIFAAGALIHERDEAKQRSETATINTDHRDNLLNCN